MPRRFPLQAKSSLSVHSDLSFRVGMVIFWPFLYTMCEEKSHGRFQ